MEHVPSPPLPYVTHAELMVALQGLGRDLRAEFAQDLKDHARLVLLEVSQQLAAEQRAGRRWLIGIAVTGFGTVGGLLGLVLERVS